MLEIVIIGSGNVAQHLIKAFERSGTVNVVQVLARNKTSISHLIGPEKIISEFSQLRQVPLYLIAVSDMAIAEVSSKIPYSGKIVAHTSGSVAIGELDGKNTRAAFYPVQTLSKNRAIDFKQVPIGIEIEDKGQATVLETLARSVSGHVFGIDSKQRKALHLAAVFSSNFVNHLYALGKEICDEHGIDFDVLRPLIQETAHKITSLPPAEAQTGPAKRGDLDTINAHLQLLDGDKAAIYRLLTQSIIEHGEKL